MSNTNQIPMVTVGPAPSLTPELPQVATDVLTGAVAAFAGGGGTPASLAESIASTAVQAAAVVFAPKIDAALAPANARLDALEQSAGAAIASHPIIQEIFALLSRFFPHETGALQAMLSPAPAQAVTNAPPR